MIVGIDARQMCGHDMRRSGLWPTDRARVEAFVQRYGGMLSAYPVGDVAIALQWEGDDGETHTATAHNMAEAFHKLRHQMKFAD